MKLVVRQISIVLLCICAEQVGLAQYQWTTPVPIDTSSHPSEIGGAMAIDDGGNIYATFAGIGPVGIYVVRSTDQGNTWAQYGFAGPELSRVPRDIVVDHKGNVWLLWVSWADEFSPAYLHLSKSIDSGRTFSPVFQSLSYTDGGLFQKLGVDAENSIYMLWDDQQFKLTKFRYGDTSQRVDAEVPNDTLLVDADPALAISNDFVVHCAWEGGFFDHANVFHEFVFYSRSVDTGATFQGRTRVDTVDRVDSFYVHHLPDVAVDGAGTVFVSYTRELVVNQADIRIVRSTDSGRSFLPPLVIAGTGTAYPSALCIDSNDGVDILWFAEDGTRQKRSIDGGASYGASTFVGSFSLHDLKSARNGFLYAILEGSRLYFSKTNVVLSVPREVISPSRVALLPNYPNPFNSSTTIQFTVAQSDLVKISVFDVLGKELASLVSERLVPGTYSTTWHGTAVGSGTYFVRLKVGANWVGTRKMVLVR